MFLNILKSSILKLRLTIMSNYIIILLSIIYSNVSLSIMGLSFIIVNIYFHYLKNIIKYNEPDKEFL